MIILRIKLIINHESFPSDFNKINITPPHGVSLQSYVEENITNAISRYNPKLNISSIEYDDLISQFPHIKAGKYSGIIVKDIEINDQLINRYRNRGCYIYSENNKKYARELLLYIFLSQVDESGRNGFISQTIFPTVLDYMEDNIISPSYTIADHKFLFINLLNKEITANMILRHIAGMYLIGIDYIETFVDSLDTSNIPKDLLEFLKTFDSDFYSNYDATTKVYENSLYKIDFNSSIVFVKSEKLIEGTNVINGRASFKGSSEKFYWIETYPIAIYAYNLGFKVDISEYEDYCSSYKALFSNRSDKFARCETLLSYFKKYMKN